MSKEAIEKKQQVEQANLMTKSTATYMKEVLDNEDRDLDEFTKLN